MGFGEILLIIAAVAFVGYIFGKEIYRKVKKLPSSDCCECQKHSMSLVKQYHKKYKK
ncbi:MAG: hypothetical protein ACI4U5_00050 [Bacilli bacterium]